MNSTQLPILGTLQKRCWLIPTFTVPSESAFSVGGQVHRRLTQRITYTIAIKRENIEEIDKIEQGEIKRYI